MDIENLTIGDLEDIEDVTGMGFPDIAAALEAAGESLPPIKIVKALVWVTKRRTDPTFELVDASKLKLADLSSLFLGDVPVDPPGAANAASA